MTYRYFLNLSEGDIFTVREALRSKAKNKLTHKGDKERIGHIVRQVDLSIHNIEMKKEEDKKEKIK